MGMHLEGEWPQFSHGSRGLLGSFDVDLTDLFTIVDGEARLRGSRCEACGRHDFPARQVCGDCSYRTMREVELSGHGTLIVSTRLEVPPMGFEEPIWVGLVELREGPRFFGLLTSPINDGGEVQAIPGDVRDRRPGFRFEAR
jgi:uncharacterized OB-fold protein